MAKVEIPTTSLTLNGGTYGTVMVNCPMLYDVYGLSRANDTTAVMNVWPSGTINYQRPIFDATVANQARAKGTICIMKGEMPANPNLLTTNMASYLPQALVTMYHDFTPNGALYTSAPAAGTNFSDPFITINSSYIAASATGTATWFAILTREWTDVVKTQCYHAIMGTVGGVGSGADLVISNPNVTAGKLYRVAGLKLSLPTVFEYQ